MKGQEVITCPQCGGNKIKQSQLATFMLVIAGLFTITVIGIPLGIGFFVAWLVMRNKHKHTFICQDCKHSFMVSDERLKKYEGHIKSNGAVLK